MTELDFIRESNRIEGIHREPTDAEIEEYQRFMAMKYVEIEDLERFVSIYQSGAVLRDREGLDVEIRNNRGEVLYCPPKGGSEIRGSLSKLLDMMPLQTPWENHNEYESLHAFTDGSGRSGRMLWMWQMKKAPLGFLHTFYYQTLSESRK